MPAAIMQAIYLNYQCNVVHGVLKTKMDKFKGIHLCFHACTVICTRYVWHRRIDVITALEKIKLLNF